MGRRCECGRKVIVCLLFFSQFALFYHAGLRWEDLLLNTDPVVAEAMELADPDVIKGRMRRLKRASDLSYKGKQYTDYADASNLDPFKLELWTDIQKIQTREEEYAIMDLHKK